MHVFERQRGEGEKAWSAFVEYLELGRDRSLAKLAHELGRKPSYKRHLERWSSAHNWVARAAAWDEHQRQERRRENAQLAEEAQAAAYDALGEALDELAGLACHSEKPGVRLGAIRLLCDIAGLTGRGVQQTVNVQTTATATAAPLPVDGLSDDALAELEAALAKQVEGSS